MPQRENMEKLKRQAQIIIAYKKYAVLVTSNTMAFSAAFRRFLRPVAAGVSAAAASSGLVCATLDSDSGNPTAIHPQTCSTGIQVSSCHTGVTQGFAGTVGNTPLIGT